MHSTSKKAGQSVAPETSAEGPHVLRMLLDRYRWQILLTYGLFNLENLLRLAQPLVLGWAINDLLRGSYRGLLVFVVQHILYAVLGTLRHAYDTRAFSRIYADLASRLVVRQRSLRVDVSQVSARSVLSRQFVDFFEQQVPMAMRMLYSLVGAVVMLSLYDPLLVLFCLALLPPAGVLSVIYGRRTLLLNGRLHDELEQEVKVIRRSDGREVQSYFYGLSHLRVQLSDWRAVNFGAMEIFVLGLLVASLARISTDGTAAAGDIFAVFRYVLWFVAGLDSLPMLVGQMTRLRDISRRFQNHAIDRTAPATLAEVSS